MLRKKIFPNLLFFYLLFSFKVFSQTPLKVFITEIAPHKVEEEEEWFEFTIESDSVVDITDWKISNGKSSVRMFEDKKDALVLSQGAKNIAGTEIDFTGSGYSGTGSTRYPEDRLLFLPENRAWFFLEKIPYLSAQ